MKEVIAMQLDPEPPGPTEEDCLPRLRIRKFLRPREYAYSDAVRSY